MWIQLVIALGLGIFLGVCSGITPGLHVNLASALIFSASGFLASYFGYLPLGVLIVSMAVTHAIVDFLPSIYLGAPEEATALSVMPGHKYLLQGFGHEAVRLAVTGAFVGVVLSVVFSPLLLIAIPIIYTLVSPAIPYILLGVAIMIILRENNNESKFWSFMVFILSGVLGLVVLSMQVKEPMLPMFSGLFGVGMLLYSIRSKISLPTQNYTGKLNLSLKNMARLSTAGLFSGSIVSLFPGIGPSHSVVIASALFGKNKPGEHLFLVGLISTITALFGLLTLVTISKARNGPIVVLDKLLTGLTGPEVYLLLCCAVAAAGLAAIIALKMSTAAIMLIEKVPYRQLCIAVVLFILAMVLLISGPVGILILATAAVIGLIPNITGINRSAAMGCLVLPIILNYLL